MVNKESFFVQGENLLKKIKELALSGEIGGEANAIFMVKK